MNEQHLNNEALTTDQLPAGYTLVSGVAIHVASLRRYTTDVHRFQRFLPFIEELESLGVGSPAWKAMVATLTRDEIRGVQLTMQETVVLSQALAADLLDGIEDEA
jgi:hypothetical protein